MDKKEQTAQKDDYFENRHYKTLQERMIEEELEKGDPHGYVRELEKEWEKFERDAD